MGGWFLKKSRKNFLSFFLKKLNNRRKETPPYTLKDNQNIQSGFWFRFIQIMQELLHLCVCSLAPSRPTNTLPFNLIYIFPFAPYLPPPQNFLIN